MGGYLTNSSSSVDSIQCWKSDVEEYQVRLRVLQEALRNAVKHSGARKFDVQLKETADEIHLTISDSGLGFNAETVKASKGLGLNHMAERLKLVKGSLSIDSQPMRGTAIRARVPLLRF